MTGEDQRVTERRIVPERIPHEQIIEAPQTKTTLDKLFVSSIRAGDTTPSVLNVTLFRANNSAPLTITNFDDGQEGQTIKILGDGQTTIQHGTRIFTKTVADELLATNLVYHFTKFGANWYEVN